MFEIRNKLYVIKCQLLVNQVRNLILYKNIKLTDFTTLNWQQFMSVRVYNYYYHNVILFHTCFCEWQVSFSHPLPDMYNYNVANETCVLMNCVIIFPIRICVSYVCQMYYMTFYDLRMTNVVIQCIPDVNKNPRRRNSI